MEDIANIIMPVSIGLIMFGIGLELRFKNFTTVFTHPKGILTGLACQLFLLPLIALTIVWFWPIDPMYKVGILLLSACPGGTASNLVTKMLKGKVALSISLTAFNSFLILFSIPFILELSFYLFAREVQNVEINFWMIMNEILFTVILPVTAGMLINESSSESFRKRLHKPLKYILPVILLTAFLVIISLDKAEREIDYLNHIHLFLPLISLNIATILLGYYVAKRLRLNHQVCYTIAIEMGLQNSVLALFIASHLLQNRAISLIAILYSSFSLISTFGVAFLLKKYGNSRVEED